MSTSIIRHCRKLVSKHQTLFDKTQQAEHEIRSVFGDYVTDLDKHKLSQLYSALYWGDELDQAAADYLAWVFQARHQGCGPELKLYPILAGQCNSCDQDIFVYCRRELNDPICRRCHPKPPPKQTHPGFVYFIQTSNGTKAIKIGHSKGDPAYRMKSLQCANPHKLILLGAIVGSYAKEQELHATFSALRLEGEWFSPGDELLAYIEKYTTTDISELKEGNSHE